MGLGDNLKQAGSNFVNNWNNMVQSIIDNAGQKATSAGDVDYANIWLHSPHVLAERILNDKTITCSITMPNPLWQDKQLKWKAVTIPFYMSDDVGMSLSNNFKPYIDQQDLFKIVKDLVNGVSVMTGNAQMTMQSRAMSALAWNGSDFSGFDVNCLFICTNRSINPVEVIGMLSKACLPCTVEDYKQFGDSVPPAYNAIKSGFDTVFNLGRDFTNAFVGAFAGNKAEEYKKSVNNFADEAINRSENIGMIAPLNYGVVFDEKGSGVTPLEGTTLTLDIGNYLHAENLVVDKISNIKFSKELIAPPSPHKRRDTDAYKPAVTNTDYGFPLYATCTISLRPYCMVDLKTFHEYLRLGNSYGQNGSTLLEPLKEKKNTGTDDNNAMELPK